MSEYYSGRVFQYHLTDATARERGLVYPALWVDSSIFECNINYDLDGGVAGEFAPAKYTVGTYTSISNPTKAGYNFQGWTVKHTYNDSLNDASYHVNYVIPPTIQGDITLTAHWTQQPVYVISYDAHGGVGAMTGTSATTGESVTLHDNVFTRDGYMFVAWNEQPNGSGPSYSNGEIFSYPYNYNLTLYAMWLPLGGVSKSIVDSGPYGVGDSVVYEITYSVPADLGVIESLTIVDRWHDPNSLILRSGVVKINNVSSTEHTVEYDADGQLTYEFKMDEIDSINVVVVTITFEIASVERGISNDVEVFVNGHSIGTGGDNLYHVAYVVNEPNVVGAVPSYTSLYKSGDEVTVLNSSLTLENQTFVGWLHNGAGKVYDAGDKFTINNVDVMLIALWGPSGGVSKSIVDSGPYGIAV